VAIEKKRQHSPIERKLSERGILQALAQARIKIRSPGNKTIYLNGRKAGDRTLGASLWEKLTSNTKKPAKGSIFMVAEGHFICIFLKLLNLCSASSIGSIPEG